MKNLFAFLVCILLTRLSFAQPNWTSIKSNAAFIVHDTSYSVPYIQPLNVEGWEDGLYITRDGKHLFSTYLPVDALSWLFDLLQNPVCFNFEPYYRGPLLGVDTVTNIFGCPNYMQSDIIISNRNTIAQNFSSWNSSNLQTSFSMDGGAQGVMLNPDSFDVFVFTKDGPGTQSTDIMFMKHVPINPGTSTAVPILSTSGQEDNPHIERLNDTSLVLFFDRDRYMYYSLSDDDGNTWQSPVQIQNVLNDQAPYDVQPHLWNDGSDWWVYFCANNSNGIRCIYKSKQMITGNWDSWGPKQLVIEPVISITGGGTIFGIGEPTLTQSGDLSFVVVYGDASSTDTTDVFDCDPWFLPKKSQVVTGIHEKASEFLSLQVSPNPTEKLIILALPKGMFSVSIYNEQGTKVKQTTCTNMANTIDCSDLNAGIYYLSANGNNKTYTTRFIKQ